MKTLEAALLVGCLAAPALAEPPRLALRLEEAERAAFAHSPLLKAAESDLAAALAQADAQLSLLAPRLTLDGRAGYQSEVPRFGLGPGGASTQFGSHESYSLGPALSYTLFDRGALADAWRSQRELARSQEAQRDLLRRQLRLLTRLDYFQVQLALEAERSLADSLRLAEAQYRDIDSRYRAGAASRVDWLSAHGHVLGRRRELRASQADAAVALRALFARTGRSQELDVSAPVDARIEEPLPAALSTPTARVELEPLESVEATLRAAASLAPDEAHPRLRALSSQAESERLSADSLAAGAWPRLHLSLRSAREFPNGPLRESVWQNTAGVAASLPLFELGRAGRQARARRESAEAAERRRDQAADELSRDWHAARDRYLALLDQEALDRVSVEETAEIARLRYASYRGGGSTILDVETANLNAVLARITAARRRAQLLIQLATLESLSAAGGRP